MRDLNDIQKANAERERREQKGDFDEEVPEGIQYPKCGECGLRFDCVCATEEDEVDIDS